MRGSVSVFVSALILVIASPSFGGMTYSTVAITGQQAPGMEDGVHFSSFMGGLLNASGQVALHCSLTGPGITSSNCRSTWTNRTGDLSLSVRAGDPAPGFGTNTTFSTLDFPTFSDSGKIVFMGIWGSPVGYWSEDSGVVSKIVKLGDFAPVPDGTAIYDDFSNGFSADYSGAPAFNGAGHTAFYAMLSNTTSVYERRCVFSEAGGTLHTVARSGHQAPDVEDGTMFQSFGRANSYRPALNNAGQTAFEAQLSYASTATNKGIFSEGLGGLHLVTRKADEAPGTQGATFYDFGDPRINDAGRTAFWAQISGATSASNTGIWSEGSGTLTLIAREGSQAPGLANGTNFAQIDDVPLINHQGYVGFHAALQGVGVNSSNDTAFWAEGPSGLSLVAREGDQVPGAPLGVVFDDLDYLDLPFLPLSMNGVGQVAFGADLKGTGITDDNKTGVFATTLDGDLITVVRAGDLFEVAPGDIRTIAAAYFYAGSGGEDGWEEAFNDAGQLAFMARFTDGTSGVFVAQIPEPCTVALLFLGSVLATRRSRRGR